MAEEDEKVLILESKLYFLKYFINSSNLITKDIITYLYYIIYIIVPPFTCIICPVTYLESSLARYKYAGASSKG